MPVVSTERVKLSAPLIEAFAGTYLSPMYDNPQPTPNFHREAWGLYCTEYDLCSILAPREHAKSTALTHDYILATVMFRDQDYIVLVSATEDLAMGHLADIAKEMRENDDLIADFQIKGLVVDSKSDIIVEFSDGHQARVIARGSGQKMRGLKWNGKRPGLIVCDDLEEDEQVENVDRRAKFRKWFYRALLPCRRRGGKVRVHGTVLHEDAILSRIQKSAAWQVKKFKAHAAFDDFTEILWPEQFPVDRLKAIRQAFIDDGDAAGYSQEYLNDPFDNSQVYLRKADFLPMDEADYNRPKRNAVGCDFAVSKGDKANRTSFTVGGKCSMNLVHILDQHVGRWDTLEWVDLMFDLQSRYNPDAWFVEGGVIWTSMWPTIRREMQLRDTWLNCIVIQPVKDKAVRGRPYQKRMRAGGMRFDKEGDWYPAYENENLRFTGTSDAVQDDQFDSTAILVKGFDVIPEVEEDDFEDEEEADMVRSDPRVSNGRSVVTGY